VLGAGARRDWYRSDSRHAGGCLTLLGYLPYLLILLILACPVMMLFMMGSMGHNHMAGSNVPQGDVSDDSRELAGLAHDEQVRALRDQLTSMAWRQEALRHDLEQLEPDRVVEAEKSAGGL
jgi:DUF2933 family protein